jgi:hypothetical protein
MIDRLAKLLAAAVLFIAAAGYPARNVLLLVADDAGLEVSQWSFFLKVFFSFEYLYFCLQRVEPCLLFAYKKADRETQKACTVFKNHLSKSNLCCGSG